MKLALAIFVCVVASTGAFYFTDRYSNQYLISQPAYLASVDPQGPQPSIRPTGRASGYLGYGFSIDELDTIHRNIDSTARRHDIMDTWIPVPYYPMRKAIYRWVDTDGDEVDADFYKDEVARTLNKDVAAAKVNVNKEVAETQAAVDATHS